MMRIREVVEEKEFFAVLPIFTDETCFNLFSSGGYYSRGPRDQNIWSY